MAGLFLVTPQARIFGSWRKWFGSFCCAIPWFKPRLGLSGLLSVFYGCGCFMVFFQDLCEALGFTAFLFQGDEGEFSSCTGEVKIDLECCYSEKPGQNGQAASAAIQTCQWCKLLSQIVQKYWIYLNLGKIQLCASHKLETLVRTFEMLTRQTASHGYHIKFPPNHHWYQVFLCFSPATWCLNCLGSDSRCWTLIHCNDRFCWS